MAAISPARELCLREHETLRNELHDLKLCQVRFLTFSFTVTAALLGLICEHCPAESDIPFYLAPLGVLIPMWWIFFDKAKTITRIVGYYRQVERMLLDDDFPKAYSGWENGLAEFRRFQHSGGMTVVMKRLRAENKTKFSSHRYWTLSYFAFLGLSWATFAASMVVHSICSTGMLVTHLSVGLILALATGLTWSTVVQLIRGRYSYRASSYAWQAVLKLDEPG